jgi:hypothetical protein
MTPEEITPEWLMQRLRYRGHLDRGSVARLMLETSSTILSVIHRLAVEYSGDAPASAPSRLFLKVRKPEVNPELARHECEFYDCLDAAKSSVSFVRCYDAAHSEDRSYVLLEDLTESHSRPPWPLPPSVSQSEQAVECLAELHASWWEDPRLGSEIGQLEGEEALSQQIDQQRERFLRFAAFLGDRLAPERRRIYESVLASLPQLSQRSTTARGRTLVHGDAHTWNFLFPNDPERDRTRLFDWHHWGIGCGTDDLACMISLHWYPERRFLLEKPLLRRYHARLAALGVSGYRWEECWQGYQLSVIQNLVTPMEQWDRNLAPFIWWPHLERAVLAFEDLRCAELIDR